MWKEKFRNYLIDISKYVLTGVVISSLFRDFGEHKFLIYGFGIAVSALALVAGLLLMRMTGRKLLLLWLEKPNFHNRRSKRSGDLRQRSPRNSA